MSKWQMIETAPKDGTEILLACGLRVTFGHWLSDEDEIEGWEGWMSWDGGFTEEQPPTHWQPLPEPPA